MQCAASEVESWVVMAVARGLIRARIDQALGIVSFSWWVQREFSMDQWVVLQKRLAQLREGVNSMLSTLETGKAPSS
ncbi:hypothetical protein EON66_05965 [archaeon]|nr:MAG: hypothetical protein EON66_05965 [archaeon]